MTVSEMVYNQEERLLCLPLCQRTLDDKERTSRNTMKNHSLKPIRGEDPFISYFQGMVFDSKRRTK